MADRDTIDPTLETRPGKRKTNLDTLVVTNPRHGSIDVEVDYVHRERNEAKNKRK